MLKTASSIIIYQGKILLLLRDNIPTIPNPNKWGIIGGQVEENESFDEAIRREVKEETNLSPSNIKYYGKLYGDGYILAFYVIRLLDEEAEEIKLGNEGQELKFFTPDEMQNIELLPDLNKYLLKFKSQVEKIINNEKVLPEDLGLEM